MKFFTRTEVIQILEIEESFLMDLESEQIVLSDESGSSESAAFSELMLERTRVAHNLVHELGVNLAGVDIILRMREDMAELRSQIESLVRNIDPEKSPRG